MAVKTKYTAIIEDEDGNQYMAVLEYRNCEQYVGGYYQKCKTINYSLLRVEIHDYGTYTVTDFKGAVESKTSLQEPTSESQVQGCGHASRLSRKD